LHGQITVIGKTPKSSLQRAFTETRAALGLAMRDLDEESVAARVNVALRLQTVGFILRVVMFICAFSGSARFAGGIFV